MSEGTCWMCMVDALNRIKLDQGTHVGSTWWMPCTGSNFARKHLVNAQWGGRTKKGQERKVRKGGWRDNLFPLAYISSTTIIPPALNWVGSFRCPFGDMSDGPHVCKVCSQDPPWYPMTWASILTLGIFKLLQTLYGLVSTTNKKCSSHNCHADSMWSLVQQR